MSIFVSKETISRLLKDVKQILKSPLTENGIYYIHDDSDIMKGYALIIGPSETPYFGGNYFFELFYPADYPHSPPKVKYWTNGNSIRFNPNLYVNGKVCISILNTWRGEGWTSCQTISSVLLTLCTLLCENPVLNEPGVNKNHKDLHLYNEIIEYKNLEIALCGMILRQYFNPKFEMFYEIITELFKEKYKNILTKVEKNASEIKVKTITTSIYNMKVIIDYNQILKLLNDCCRNLNV